MAAHLLAHYVGRYLSVNGVSCLDINDNDLNVYLKLFVLLYAADIVVFATSGETLIQSLNLFSNYCNPMETRHRL